MAYELKTQCVVLFMAFLGCILGSLVEGEPQVPCYFIFGDSLVDNGNNNNLLSLAKSNFHPYGIDFRSGPTGRFTNNRTMTDITAELLGFKNYTLLFATARGAEILLGVNYASAAARIRRETGRNLGDRISLDDQLKNHQTTITNMMFNIFGNTETTTTYLIKCLYSVGMGSNDYINNYFMPLLYPTSRQYTPEQYATVLIQQYSQQIKTLYNYGARKVVLSGLGPIGCIPYEIATFGTKNGAPCVDNINEAVQYFNNKLIALVNELNNNLTDAKFIFVNLYDLTTEDFANPSPYGLKVLNKACCGLGKNNAQIFCLPGSIPCKKRNEYAFWDAYHLTESAYLIAASRSYSAAGPCDTYPFDIKHLVQAR